MTLYSDYYIYDVKLLFYILYYIILFMAIITVTLLKSCPSLALALITMIIIISGSNPIQVVVPVGSKFAVIYPTAR